MQRDATGLPVLRKVTHTDRGAIYPGRQQEQGTRNRQQRNRKQVSETGTGTVVGTGTETETETETETGAGTETETETETGTGTGTEKRQGIGKRLPRTPKPERRKTSGKQTGNSRNRNPAHRRAQWISGKKFAGTKKSGYLCNPESGRFPRPEMPGIDTRQPSGVAQGQSRGQGRERRGVAQSG